MAQIGYGYGSEYQLLRFLGHHRHELEKTISKQIGEGTFEWEDFGYANPKSVISGDKELTGLSFLQRLYPKQYHYIKEDLKNKKYHFLSGSWQHWDAIFTHNGTLYLVEAKAHTEELSSGNKEHGDSSKELILDFFREQLGGRFPGISREWLKNYYQLANRLAITAYLNKKGIKTKALYIFFENGYRKRVVEHKDGKEIIYQTLNLNATKENFTEAINSEMLALGIDKSLLSDLLAPAIFIDAEPVPYK